MVVTAPAAAADRPTHVLVGAQLRHAQAEPAEIQTLNSTSEKQTRAGLVGDLWIHKSWPMRGDMSGFAVPIKPSEAGRGDAMQILADDSAPGQTFYSNPANANKVHVETVLMGSVADRYELFLPGTFKPAARCVTLPPTRRRQST
jgi:hypothetical protein